MKVIIDIPDQIYDWIEHTGVVHHEDCGYLGGAILDGITIPDNATNGDVIKAICPMWINYHDTDIEVTVDKKVWNAPYKAGDTDGNS